MHPNIVRKISFSILFTALLASRLKISKYIVPLSLYARVHPFAIHFHLMVYFCASLSISYCVACLFAQFMNIIHLCYAQHRAEYRAKGRDSKA